FCFLCSSNGFMDYTTSGLENISSFAAIGWIFYFYSICLKNKDAKKSDFTMLFFLFFLMIFIRHDLLTLVIIPACYIFYVNRNKFSFKEWIVLFSFCSFPIALWTIFSLVYYGFPFPNTAYAKLNTGYSVKDLAPQGINYFLYSAKYDATTILGLVAGVVCSFFALKPGYWPLSLGVLLNVIYVISIGGDFMQGRFVSHSFLVAVFLACLAVERLSF